MIQNSVPRVIWPLLLGDALAILIAVYLGFRFHSGGEIFLSRFAYTFFPWLLAWLIAGLPLGLFGGGRLSFGASIGRVLWAMLLASPLAALLRAAWLGTGALPLFALIMGLVSALAILIWRGLYAFLLDRNAN